ncbi:MAG: tetratricopeptide repeat protein [Candidatus Binatia bacterium]
MVALIVLPALVVALYAPTADAPFLFDDQTSIVFNPGVQKVSPLLARFLSGNRPLTDLTFALNYAHAASQTRGYHAVNIALHAANGLLVYAVARLALGSPAVAMVPGGAAPWLALGAAALFAAHPLQTETAAYVSGRSEALASGFYLLTVLLYAIAARTRQRLARLALVTALLLTCAAALASKEMAATIPAGLVLYDWCFVAGGSWRDLRRRWPLIAVTLIPFALGVPILLRRDYHTPSAGFNFSGFGPWDYLLTQWGVVLHYLRLTLVPIGLCFDTEWPLAKTLWSPAVLASLGLLLGLVLVAVLAVRRQPVLTFAILWVLVVLAPTSSVVPIADLVAERRMYLALMGPVLLAVVAAWQVAGLAAGARRRASLRPLVCGLLTVTMVAALSLLTTGRVRVWADPVALQEDTVAKAPTNPRAHLNLGAVYLDRNRLDAAELEVLEAQRLYERGESVHTTDRIGGYIYLNLCSVLYRRQQLDAAAQHCQRALQLGRSFVPLRSLANLYLGQIATRQQQWPVAIGHYRAACWDDVPTIRTYALLHLADAYWRSGQSDLARQSLNVVLREDPKNPEAVRLQQVLDRAP